MESAEFRRDDYDTWLIGRLRTLQTGNVDDGLQLVTPGDSYG
jgi:hypothetical protein